MSYAYWNFQQNQDNIKGVLKNLEKILSKLHFKFEITLDKKFTISNKLHHDFEFDFEKMFQILKKLDKILGKFWRIVKKILGKFWRIVQKFLGKFCVNSRNFWEKFW